MARVAVVLGAGGTLGFAYHAGTLAALAEATGWDPRKAEVVVGTSAGSVAASLLRAGLSGPDLAARTAGEPLTPGGRLLASQLGQPVSVAARFPRPARGRFGSAALLRRALLRPGSVRLGTALAAALPPGTRPTEIIVGGLRGVLGSSWPERPTWICAVRLDDGARVVFGTGGAPEASWPDAVAASCAIPAFFQPVEIGGRRYVDGGVHSATNLDLLAGLGLDLVVVSAPMSAREALIPSLDLPLRAASAARLAGEAARVRRRGTPVVVIHPTAADRRVMGLNPMDGRRRRAVATQARESALEWLRGPGVRRQLEPILQGG